MGTVATSTRVVQTGEPRVVLIVGATGIGKSRTAQAVMQTIEAAGHMETAMLRYHRPATADDGYRRAVLDILARGMRIGPICKRDFSVGSVAINNEHPNK